MFNGALNSSSNMITREKFNKRAEENKMLYSSTKFFFSGIYNLIDFVNQ